MKKQVNALVVASIMIAGVLGSHEFVTTSHAQGQVVVATNVLDYQNHTSKASIEYVINNNLMWKYSDGSFRPNSVITQAQLISSLVAVRNIKEKASLPQIPVGHWAKDSYEKASKAGILDGITIAFNKSLTKEDVAKLVFNTWKQYRGVKVPTYTNTQALITWGWMKPNQIGEKFKIDLPVSRADVAEILKYLHKDRLGIEAAEKYSMAFHNSLKVTNGVLSGQVPSGDKSLTVTVRIYDKNNKLKGYTNGKKFAVKVADIKHMLISVTSTETSSSMSSYRYAKLPQLIRTEERQKFSF